MAKMQIVEDRILGRRAMARKEAKEKRKVARETAERACCRKRGNKNLYAIDEDESENIEETFDNDEEAASVVFAGRKRK